MRRACEAGSWTEQPGREGSIQPAGLPSLRRPGTQVASSSQGFVSLDPGTTLTNQFLRRYTTTRWLRRTAPTCRQIHAGT